MATIPGTDRCLRGVQVDDVLIAKTLLFRRKFLYHGVFGWHDVFPLRVEVYTKSVSGFSGGHFPADLKAFRVGFWRYGRYTSFSKLH